MMSDVIDKLIAQEKTDKDDNKLPENTLISIDENDIKEQLGHMTIRMLQLDKTITHLHGVIKDLRNGT